MKKLLLHKDIFMPQWVTNVCCKKQKQKKSYTITDHFLRGRSGLDSKHNVTPEKLLQIADTLTYWPVEPFEVELTKRPGRKLEVTKYVIRLPYDNTQDISIVFRDNRIITCWLNSESDEHFTLKAEKYNTRL